MQYVYEHVRLGTKRLSAFDLLTRGRNHYQLMLGQPVFAYAQNLLPGLAEACNALDAAAIAHDHNPGPRERSARDAACEVLRYCICSLGSAVQTCSNGNAAIIRAAGFGIKGKRQASQPLKAPDKVIARPTDHAGRIRVQWGGVKYRRLYRVWITKEDPSMAESWRLFATTTKNRLDAMGLESDVVHHFRITALGVLGESPLSDIAQAKAV